MSLRYTGAWLQDGAFNPLTAPTPIIGYELYSWGANSQGQLGLGDTTTRSSPVQVGALTNWLNIAAGYYFAAGVKNDGTLWTWGQGTSYGALGLGNTTNYSSPKQVGTGTTWSKISCGQSFVTAIKNDGTIWSWGQNGNGQLGLGNVTNYSSPKQIGALTTWSSVSSGNYYVSAIKTDGTLWSWGFSNYGQLGLGDTTSRSSPVQVGALTNWRQVSCSASATVAIKTDGTIWSWGYGGFGQLGFNNNYNYSSPKQIGALTNWLSISCGSYHELAIKTDGTFWSWGYNGQGQLGLNLAATYRSSPNQVGALTTWSSASGGIYFSLAISTNGGLWSFGRNSQGSLGLGNTTDYSSPKQVGSATDWAKVTRSVGYTSLGLKG
jgi:alpha-tubulin suppressor-like RCC1 family protein